MMPLLIVSMLLAAMLPFASVSAAPLVTTEQTGSNLANSLVGAGVTIANATFVGKPAQGGSFTGGSDVVGFESGIILGSGNIADVVGPNDSSSTATYHFTDGDTDLTALSGSPTFDAAVLEFDFVPNADKVFFQYVFSSEEYNEYVGSQYNDVFAFYINGVNCATVGDPAVAVTINTINTGANAPLFINNELGVIATDMDGLTVVLTCSADVLPNVTNHIKLAIADAGDYDYDSNVFIKAGSFSTTPPPDTCTSNVGFKSPLEEGKQNLVKAGQVVPVKADLECGGVLQAGLTPSIQLFKGDVDPTTESGATTVSTMSVSAADTTGLMRAAGQFYLYNLQVPSSAKAGDLYTIRVRPFGASDPRAQDYIILKIRK